MNISLREHKKLFLSAYEDPQVVLVCPSESCCQIISPSHVRPLSGNGGFEFHCPTCHSKFLCSYSTNQPEPPPSGGDDVEGAPRSDRSRVAADAASSYLEVNRIIVDEDSEQFELCPKRCKSVFCPRCSLSEGLKVRDRLTQAVSKWQAVFMLTLTVDPELFDCPETAHRYVQERRAISELVRALKKRNLLFRKHYFCVVEWQHKSEMAHYHLLLETKYINFDLLCEIWNRNRPSNVGPIEGNRPGFGSIRFSAPKFKSNEHAARYATKYLTKQPEHCFPKWVLGYEGRIKRYLTSHGFWKAGDPDKKKSTKKLKRFVDDSSSESKPRRKTATVGERVQQCGEEAVILKIVSVIDQFGESHNQRIFFANCFKGYHHIRSKLGISEELPVKKFSISKDEAYQLCGLTRGDILK